MIDSFLRYLGSEKRYSPHTLSAYQKDLHQFESFLIEHFEISNPESAKHIHLRGWVVDLMENDISPRTINRKIACLKSFYKYLLIRDYIKANPATQLKPLKSEKDLPAFVKEKEIANLFDQLDFPDSFVGYRDKLILELLYGTGMRLAELIGVKLKDVNFYDQTILVLGKRNKERILPISNTLVDLLGEYQHYRSEQVSTTDRLLVTNKGEKLYPMFVNRVVKKYLDQVTTLTKKSPHVLRHTFATHLLNKGADLNAVKDLLGHTSLAATQVYTHNSIEKLKAAFEKAHPKA